jgi:hypothetical protein
MKLTTKNAIEATWNALIAADETVTATERERLFEQLLALRNDIPRAAFTQKLLYSFGAYMTVCKIERDNAEV